MIDGIFFGFGRFECVEDSEVAEQRHEFGTVCDPVLEIRDGSLMNDVFDDFGKQGGPGLFFEWEGLVLNGE